MKRFVLTTWILAIAIFSFAQNTQIDRANELLGYRGEIFFSFEMPPGANPLHIVKNLSVEKIAGNTVFAFANQKDFEEFLKNGIDFKLVDEYYESKNITMATTVAAMSNWDRYPTYGVYVEMMNKFAADYPNLCKIFNVGATASGNRHLYFAKITSNVNSHKKKPQVMYTSTMHGDETTGFVLLLRLIDYLLSNYGTNSQVTHLLDNLEIWICPNENPDGTYRTNNSTIQSPTRFNSNNIDLNRNYPCPRPGVTIQTPIQPETQAMMNFTDTMSFVLSANIHGGIELVNYPWDAWKSSENRHADHDWFYLVSREYADTARFYSPTTYMNPSSWQCASCINGVTHGADWYYVYGSRQDFMNYFRRVREVTLELSNTKLLPSAHLPAHWNYNFRSLLNYLYQATFGIHGTVRDINTLQPINAKIEILGYDKDNTQVYSYLPMGLFHRPILAGTYSLRVTAKGYPEKIIHGVTVQNRQTLNLDIRLGSPTSIAELNSGVSLNVHPNPVNHFSVANVYLQQAGEVRLQIINLNGKVVSMVFSGFLNQGNNQINLGAHTGSLQKGLYLLRAVYPGGSKTSRLVVL